MGCLDSGCAMTLIDAKLARSLRSDIKKIEAITVNGIGSQYVCSAYVGLDLFFFVPQCDRKNLH